MNPKQTVPLIATLAPLAPAIAPAIPILLMGGAMFLTLKWLLSDDEETKPETVPVTAAPPHPALVVPPVSGGNSVQNRSIPVNSGGNPTVTPAPSVSASAIVPASPVPPPSIIPVVKIQPEILPRSPIKKKFVTREDLAAVFQRGTRALTRTAAVAALKKIGFGKSAAYDALSEDGRFSAWLQFAPDGIISWTD